MNKKAASAAFFSASRIRQCLTLALPIGWVIPNHYYPWTASWGEGVTIIIFLLLGWCFCAGRSENDSIFWPLKWLFVIATATCTSQWVTGRIHFFGDFILPVLYLCLWFLAINLGKKLYRLAEIEWFAAGILLFAVLSSFAALVQWLEVDGVGSYVSDLQSGGRPFGNLAQPNNFSTVCMLGIAAVGYLHSRQRFVFGVALFIAGVLGFGLVLSSSRTGWLQLLAVNSFFWFFRKKQGCREILLLMLTTLVVCMVLRVMLPILADALLITNPRSFADQVKAGLRFEMWKMALNAIATQPWYGYGWQQGNAAQQQVALQFPPHHEHFEHAHNLVLDVMLWNGVIVGSLICVLLISWLIAVIRNINCVETVFGFAIVLVLLSHALLEYPLSYSYFLLPLGLAMGVAETGVTASRTPRILFSGWHFSIILLTATLIFYGVSSEYLRAENRFRELRLESYGIGPNPPSPGLEGYLFIDHLDQYMNFIATPATPGISTNALREMSAVATRFGYAPVLMRYALALGLNGKDAEAIRTLETLCHIHAPIRCVEAVDGWSNARIKWPSLPLWRIPESVPHQ